MPMSREDYENLLNELMTPELDHSTKTDILQKLRVDYTNVHSEFDELTKTSSRLQKDNEDLVVSNSKLFRQLGVVGTPNEEKEEKKEFSETITIEQLEKI